jgi:hypothetical protein
MGTSKEWKKIGYHMSDSMGSDRKRKTEIPNPEKLYGIYKPTQERNLLEADRNVR